MWPSSIARVMGESQQDDGNFKFRRSATSTYSVLHSLQYECLQDNCIIVSRAKSSPHPAQLSILAVLEAEAVEGLLLDRDSRVALPPENGVVDGTSSDVKSFSFLYF